jgi:hypothetical protein
MDQRKKAVCPTRTFSFPRLSYLPGLAFLRILHFHHHRSYSQINPCQQPNQPLHFLDAQTSPSPLPPPCQLNRMNRFVVAVLGFFVFILFLTFLLIFGF